jgi:hypothetical protein
MRRPAHSAALQHRFSMLKMASKIRIDRWFDPVHAAGSIELLAGIIKVLLWRVNRGRRRMPQNAAYRNNKNKQRSRKRFGDAP